MTAGDAVEAVQRAYRSEYGRTVAILMRTLGGSGNSVVSGSLGDAEDAVQDAFVAAAETWPEQGVPPNPQAWIVTTARRRAIDRIRRMNTAQRHVEQVAHEQQDEQVVSDDADDELRMILLCTHPRLSPESQVALTLRYAGGLTAAEIARAFGTSEATMAQRLSRAKRTIKDARIGLPEPDRIEDRLPVVLAVIYAIYNEGYTTTSGELSRVDLCQEGVRLARLVAAHGRSDLEATGLLALLLLLQARRRARISADGSLVPLPDQDRSAWDQALIAEGQALVRHCLAVNKPGQYQVQAAIQAVHCDAGSDEDTDWTQILALYDMLLTMVPTPAARTARIVALSHVEGPARALAELDATGAPGTTTDAADRYTLAVRADLLGRTGESEAARDVFLRAAELADNEAEREHLLRRAEDVDPAG
ncbi:MAG TPA: sigma-70 family RNA polymerase sigma factor [Candidatus Corynebacterium avicola]|uniref:Sigma-70 family RNA polymerase sigma factor n=1 Tax=Candidatus Corynebacterium avicola TaxID=2838527 RepID=A0A9D1RRT0_9CORY|nr:sigma-70 family RNA polymerase sigma factor [Candidatus Corynebacterium avicola]